MTKELENNASLADAASLGLSEVEGFNWILSEMNFTLANACLCGISERILNVIHIWFSLENQYRGGRKKIRKTSTIKI